MPFDTLVFSLRRKLRVALTYWLKLQTALAINLRSGESHSCDGIEILLPNCIKTTYLMLKQLLFIYNVNTEDLIQ